jgi:hypothetical protein
MTHFVKKNRIHLILVVVLIIIAVILILNKSASTLRKDYMEFAVKDTASITRIFMSDKKNNKVLLVRQNEGKWKLNNEYEATTDGINVLLKTLANIAVSAPVSKAAYKNVITRMSAIATKVEVYQQVYRINIFNAIKLFRHEKLVKTFYVGDATKENTGTYMLIEGSDMPFITYIPSFRGYLSSRFIPLEDAWRDHTVFNIFIKDIKSVRVEYPSAQDSSFVVNEVGKFTYSLSTLNGKKQLPYDTLKLLKYLSFFQNINYESLLNDIDKAKKDSIISSKPWHIISITDNKGKTISVKTFPKSPAYGKYYDDLTSQLVLFDRDRLYALINNDKDLALIQFYVFDKILKNINYFNKN